MLVALLGLTDNLERHWGVQLIPQALRFSGSITHRYGLERCELRTGCRPFASLYALVIVTQPPNINSISVKANMLPLDFSMVSHTSLESSQGPSLGWRNVPNMTKARRLKRTEIYLVVHIKTNIT